MKLVDRTPLRDQAREIIRASIVSGELKQGEIYSALTLGKRIGVSATPVREAMLDLATAGLVEVVRNRGFRILTMSETDLDEIYGLRSMLEVPAMRTIVERIDDAGLERAESALLAYERAADAADTAGLLVADRDFHLTLLAYAGNARLVRLIGELRDQTRLVGIRQLVDTGQLRTSVSEHRAILDAVRARDPRAAEAAMQAHLDHIRGAWAGRSEPEAS